MIIGTVVMYFTITRFIKFAVRAEPALFEVSKGLDLLNYSELFNFDENHITIGLGTYNKNFEAIDVSSLYEFSSEVENTELA